MRVPLWLILATAIFLCPAAHAAETDLDNREITDMYQADQADRQFFVTHKPSEWTPETMRDMAAHDEVRRKRITVLLVEGKVVTALDYYHAAMIYQHSDQAKDFLQAHVLSNIAAFKGYAPARWLAAASLDRYLQKIKQPQIFGTQYLNSAPKGAASGWTMDPYDRSLPDSVRKAYDVPPLEEGLKRLDALRNNQPLVKPGTAPPPAEKVPSTR